MDPSNTSVNEFLEEYKDFSLNEMKPCLDVLFHAYDYEKEQIGIVDTITCEEYENLVKEFKLKRSMALKIKTDVTCCVCGESLVRIMPNGEKEPITLFGCGHAGHRSCIDGDCCPVQGCWDDIKTEKKAVNRHASVVQIHYNEMKNGSSTSSKINEESSIEDVIDNLNNGDFNGSNTNLSVAAPTPSAIFRRKWLLKAVNMSSCLEMDVDI